MDAIVGITSFGLGVPGVIELCIRAGRYLVGKIDDYREAPAAIQELRQFGVGMINGQLKMHMENGVAAMADPNFDDSLKQCLNNCIDRIRTDLIAADRLLDKHQSRDGKLDRLSYVFMGKSALEKIVKSLRRQERDFSLLMNNIYIHRRMGTPRLLLSASQFRVIGETDGLAKPGVVLPHSNVYVVEGNLRDCELARDIVGTGTFILEGKNYVHEGASEEAANDIQLLASKLAKAGLHNGIPRLVGYRHAPNRRAYELVFALPKDFGNPRSLHDLLLDPSVKIPSLTSRLNICDQLAKAVLYTHGLGVVHKNIRPENLILLLPKQSQYENGARSGHMLNTLLLTNWELTRNLGEATCFVGHDDWQRGIYQHPKRQGRRAEDEYNMGHDIYSLGVCMLEIFLWKTFVAEGGVISQLYQDRAIAIGLVAEGLRGNTQKMVRKPSIVQKVLVDIAKTELPPAVGDPMTELVLKCLKCLEGGFGSEAGTFAGRSSQLETELKYIQDVMSVFSGYSSY